MSPRRRLATAAAAIILGLAPALTSAATTASADPNCPDSGWACFYGGANFTSNLGHMIKAPADADDVYGIVSVRNRTDHVLCLRNKANGATAAQGPHSQAPNIGHGWNQVTAHVTFVPVGTAC
ncbi:peptidase inhibitor family I36 protein [Streptomyces sp. CT34]|uniref:peptidase inhibitor family I36 protein n=1 Tax=Streptomyces sp. CT34 TaxID=1553907 RepID=UPI0005BD4256|nr:peptidase inhibitor family I36 protein [Streptomyces sp. CT34]